MLLIVRLSWDVVAALDPHRGSFGLSLRARWLGLPLGKKAAALTGLVPTGTVLLILEHDGTLRF
jgi:hypothetical protein